MVILRADKVLLRPWQVEDARWYVEARDEEIFRWTTEKRALSVAEAEAAIQQINSSGDKPCFAIIEPQSGELLGNIALALDEPGDRSGEIMYWLAAPGRGRGIATQAVKVLCQWAFATLALEQIGLRTLVDNLASQRVAERAGFQRTQTQTEHLWFTLTKP